jgi:hypothetical protein
MLAVSLANVSADEPSTLVCIWLVLVGTKWPCAL